MRSLVGIAGSYSQVELHAWYLWIAIDHIYYPHTRSYGVTRAPSHGFSCIHDMNPILINFQQNMRSFVTVAGSYSNVELHAWYPWITIDHTYYTILGLMGSLRAPSNGFSCQHDLNPWNISFPLNMRSLVGVAGSYYNIEIRNWFLWITVAHTYNRIPGRMGSHELLCRVLRAKLSEPIYRWFVTGENHDLWIFYEL